MIAPMAMTPVYALAHVFLPNLVKLNVSGVALQEQQRLLSSCGTEVVQPWQETTVPDPNFPSAGPVYQEAARRYADAEKRARDTRRN